MTSHLHVQLIVNYLYKRGVQHVVLSPGSRSAPFVIALNEYTSIKKYVIVDERVAGYFALGIAQQIRKPVVVICTSGTATLNLGPALAEADNQMLPLIAITADRPLNLYGTGENQTINQVEMFRNFVKVSIDFSPINSMDDFTRLLSTMDESICSEGYTAPSHWNVHIPEPLYEIAAEETPYYELPQIQKIDFAPYETQLEKLVEVWESAKRIMIISGYEKYSESTLQKLQELEVQSKVVFISEHASNVPTHQDSTWNVDAMFAQITPTKEKLYVPDLVITLGRHILSKKLKGFIRQHKPKYHFQISPYDEYWNQFLMNKNYEIIHEIDSYDEVLSKISYASLTDSAFKNHWNSLKNNTHVLTEIFLEKIPFCDFKAYHSIFKALPSGVNLQLGNSSPVRYAQFFNLPKNTLVNANRGTSGIDGCLSTATGSACVNNRMTVVLLGDISFFYDSNALWNNYLTADLKIIVLNNGGGNIFRLINGPDTVKHFEKHFETPHQLTAKYLARMFDLHYYICDSETQLNETLPSFFETKKKASILEIKTDGKTSAAVFKQYFSFLKNQQ